MRALPADVIKDAGYYVDERGEPHLSGGWMEPNEQLRCRFVDGRWRDQYGRDGAKCREHAEEARSWADDLEEAAAAIEGGMFPLGRLGGKRFVQRVQQSAATFARVATRDAEFARLLDEKDAA